MYDFSCRAEVPDENRAHGDLADDRVLPHAIVGVRIVDFWESTEFYSKLILFLRRIWAKSCVCDSHYPSTMMRNGHSMLAQPRIGHDNSGLLARPLDWGN